MNKQKKKKKKKNLGGRQSAHGLQPRGLRREVRRSCPRSGIDIAKEHDPRTGHHLFGRAGSHQADGIGRTRPKATVRHPGAKAHRGSTTASARYHHRDPVVPGPQRDRLQREGRRVGQDCGRAARHL